MAAKRAVRQFTLDHEPWPVINDWANATGYRRIGGGVTDGTIHGLYQKGSGFWVAPRRLEVHTQGNQVRIEAWVHAGFFARLMSFFILPAEITIESGGFTASIPRKIARGEVNKLFERLHQPQLT